MNKKRWLVLCLVVVAIAAWRLWPRSVESLLCRPLAEADRVTCRLTAYEEENGGYGDRAYELIAETPEESRAVLDILRRGKYRASFTNLLPWTWGSLSSGYKWDGRHMMVTLLSDGEEPWAAMLIIYGSDKASIDGRQVYPVGNEMFDELAEYIQTHGELLDGGG